MASVIAGGQGINERESKNNGKSTASQCEIHCCGRDAVAMATCRVDGSRRVNNSSQGGEAEVMCRI